MTGKRSGFEDFSHTTLPNLKQPRLDEDSLHVGLSDALSSKNDVEHEEGLFRDVVSKLTWKPFFCNVNILACQ